MVFEDIPMGRRVGAAESGVGLFEYFRGDQARPPLIKKYPGSNERMKVIQEKLLKLNMAIEHRLYGKNISPAGNGQGQERIVTVQRTEDGVRIQLLATHFFESGDVKVRRGAMRDLDEIAQLLKGVERPLTIEGHTDSIPPKGNLTNWELSAMRASNIVRYLIRNHDVPASQLTAAGYADTRPIADNDTEIGRALNRRIEIRINYAD